MSRTLIFAAVLALAPCALMAQQYQVSDLDTSAKLENGWAFSVAENGRAVGMGLPDPAQMEQAILWDASGTTLLPYLTDTERAWAYDISEQGDSVGECQDWVWLGHMYEVTPYAVKWAGGVPVTVSSLATTAPPDLHLRDARRITEKGLIMGMGRYDATSIIRAWLFEDGVVTDLGSLKQDGSSEPFDMNEQGHIVGWASDPGNWNHACLWKDGQVIDLHDPLVIEGPISSARGINEFGMIVGGADFVDDLMNYETAAVWDDGKIVNLGVFGGPQSFAHDVNDFGVVVGESTTDTDGIHAFIWRGGKMIDLNDLIPPKSGWKLEAAFAVNNSEWIVGRGLVNYFPRPFLLVPDQKGGFAIYGAGCKGSYGYTPGFYGQGECTSSSEISAVLVNGHGGMPGLLLFGSGYSHFAFKPGCVVQIMPLLPPSVFLTLMGSEAGAGSIRLDITLPPGLTPAAITMQFLLMDPGGPGGFTVSNPLEMNIQ
jgi:probable HAF family extracellular repeat protein